MEPFHVGTEMASCLYDALEPFCAKPFLSKHSHMSSSKRQPLSIYQKHEKFLKNCSHHTCVFRSLKKMFFESKFSSYRLLSSVNFPLASFLCVPDENGSGNLHENLLVPCGTYFLGGPVLVPLAVLYGTVPSVLV